MFLPTSTFPPGRWLGLGLVLALANGACSGESTHVTPPPKPPACSFSLADASTETEAHALRINEVMTGNDGAWVDEQGETDDFIELVNTSSQTIQLADYYIGEKPREATRLPELELAAGATVLLWADSDPKQARCICRSSSRRRAHRLLLWAATCELVDLVEVPELPALGELRALARRQRRFFDLPLRHARPQQRRLVSAARAAEPDR